MTDDGEAQTVPGRTISFAIGFEECGDLPFVQRRAGIGDGQDRAIRDFFGSQKTVAGVECGNANQRPCKVWERIPSCNANLKEDFARGICVAVNCGKENSRPCLITERIPSCDNGLVEDFLQNRCIKSADARRQEIAARKMAEIARFILSKLNIAQGVANNPSVRNTLNSSRPESVGNAVSASAVGQTRMPDGNLLRTMTIGASAGAKVIFGGSAGAGGTIDLTGRLPTYAYGTADYSISLGFGGGAGIDVGFWVCQANKIGGDSWGVEFGPADIIAAAKWLKGVEGAKLGDMAKPGFDVGVALWFDYDNVFQGFSLTPNLGAGADVGGVVKATTSVQDDPRVNCDGTPARGGVTPRPVVVQPSGGQLTYIQDIRVGRNVLRHSRIIGGASSRAVTRVCLRNRTNRGKQLQYRVNGVNPLNAATPGSQSCANFPSSMRLNYAYVDVGGPAVKNDAMNLSGYAGDIVVFEWLSH